MSSFLSVNLCLFIYSLFGYFVHMSIFAALFTPGWDFPREDGKNLPAKFWGNISRKSRALLQI